jgi:hypothetical protein
MCQKFLAEKCRESETTYQLLLLFSASQGTLLFSIERTGTTVPISRNASFSYLCLRSATTRAFAFSIHINRRQHMVTCKVISIIDRATLIFQGF